LIRLNPLDPIPVVTRGVIERRNWEMDNLLILFAL